MNHFPWCWRTQVHSQHWRKSQKKNSQKKPRKIFCENIFREKENTQKRSQTPLHRFPWVGPATPRPAPPPPRARRLSSGSPVLEEAVLADAGGHVVDMLLPAQRLVVEADGPVHFLRTPHGPVPDGSTLLKRTQLRRAGYAVVSVAYFEWNAVPPAGREEFLSCRIRTAVM